MNAVNKHHTLPCFRLRAIVCSMMLAFGTAQAGEFRTFRPILTPAIVSGGGTVEVQPLASVSKPVSRNLAAAAMNKIIAAWNGDQVDKVLGNTFYDKSRLNNAMNSRVPRDARLSVLGIQGVQTLGQHTQNSPSGELLVRTVSITVKTQLTFNDPVNGYQRRDGTSEYIVRIKQLLRR